MTEGSDPDRGFSKLGAASKVDTEQDGRRPRDLARPQALPE